MENRLTPTAGTTHALTITHDGLPLLLLAAVHHPDAGLRGRLLARIEGLLEARGPLASSAEVRRLLARCRGSPAAPFDLDPASLELAVRVVRLVFARATNLHHKHRLLIIGPDDDRQRAVLAYAPFRVEPMEQTRYGSLKQRRFQARLLTGAALERLATFHFRPPPFQVTCRAGAGFVLDVCGQIGGTVREAALLSGLTLSALGMALDLIDGVLRITTTTAESIIRFSACLARGETLRLKLGPRLLAETHLFIRLRDFDEAEAELPVAVFPGVQDEDWVAGLPPVQMEVPVEDVLAVIRWAYPPEDWLVPEVRELLVY